MAVYIIEPEDMMDTRSPSEVFEDQGVSAAEGWMALQEAQEAGYDELQETAEDLGFAVSRYTEENAEALEERWHQIPFSKKPRDFEDLEESLPEDAEKDYTYLGSLWTRV